MVSSINGGANLKTYVVDEGTTLVNRFPDHEYGKDSHSINGSPLDQAKRSVAIITIHKITHVLSKMVRKS